MTRPKQRSAARVNGSSTRREPPRSHTEQCAGSKSWMRSFASLGTGRSSWNNQIPRRMMKSCSIRICRGHAEPLSGDRKLRKVFPIDYRRDWHPTTRGSITYCCIRDSEGLSHRLCICNAPSGDWDIRPGASSAHYCSLGTALPALLTRAQGGSHSSIANIIGGIPLLPPDRLTAPPVTFQGSTNSLSD